MPITTCDSPETLKSEIETIRKKVSLDESEETWDMIAQAILRLTRLCKNGGCEFPSEMVVGIRSISRPLNSALNSERSRLSGAAVELVTALATGLGSSFDPLVFPFVPTLLGLCGRTNKVFTSRARTCVLAVIQHTRLPSLVPCLAELANHKSVFSRLTAAEGILACLNCFNPPDLEKESRARTVEDIIKLTARDASADVRKASKEVFKAYKTLMPSRVDNFIAPLTPVVKKYLDIQTGPSGIISSSAGQRQTSRPSSRANNNVMEAVQRPASTTSSKPPTRPATNDPTHSIRQQPAVHGPPSAVDVRVPRQRTVSQMQRGPPQSRNLHITAQSSSAAQRSIVPTSASTRQAVQRPPPGAVRVLPAPKGALTGGPQRPPPAQIKFNPPPDRLKVIGTGAKRVPLPSVPVDGHASDQAGAAADSRGRTGSTVDKPRSKLPGRRAEATVPGKSAAVVGRKATEGTRLASSSNQPANRLAPTVAQRSHPRARKGETSNPMATAPQRRPAFPNAEKPTRPLVKPEKETSPTLIPLPPSPSVLPTEIALPPSRNCTPPPTDPEAREEPVAAARSGSIVSSGIQSECAEPCPGQGDIDMGAPNTPITTLLSSIQRGFLFTPSTPLSPPQNYLPAYGNLPEQRQNQIIVSDLIKCPSAAPFCVPPQDDSAVDSLDRHALRDLN